MLSLILTLALDGAAVAAPPAGTYRYDAAINRRSVGGTTVTVSSTPQGLKLVENGASHLPTGDTYTRSTLLLDASLIPIAYSSSYKSEDQQMQASVAFGGRAATVTTGTDKRTFPLGGSSKSFVVIDASTMSGFLMLPSQMRAFKDADATVLVPGLGAESFLSVLSGVTPSRPDKLPAADVSVSFSGDAPFVEWYDPSTFIVDEVDVPGQNLTITRRR